MKGKNQHVVPRGERWAVQPEGGASPSFVTEKKSDAERIARDIARREESELFVHGRDGRIQRRDSHGHDPRRSKG